MAKGGARPGSGRKPGKSKATLVREKIEDFVDDAKFKELMEYAMQRAKKSDIILKFILEQKLGKAPQRVELTGKDGEPIQISWIK